jgi:uncharacterized protein YbjQ (UPF0145 family)
MGEMIQLLLSIGIPLVLLAAGLLIGGAIERAHLRRLDQREQELSGILVSDMRWLPAGWQVSDGHLVVGQAVIATDYFKVFVAGLRNLFGGRVRSYETLMERARREALVRMLDQARAAGCNVVWSVRLETSTIQGKQQGKSGGVEVMAYGTAMRAA